MVNHLVTGALISFLGVLFIFFLKDKSKVSNQILISFFVFSTIRYSLEAIPIVKTIPFIGNLVGISGNSHLAFVFLYIKYITSDFKTFKKRDLLYFLPILFLFLYNEIINFNGVLENLSSQPIQIKILPLFYVSLWVFYVSISIKVLLRHRSKIRNHYSSESARILLYWVWGIIFYYVAIYILTMLIHGFSRLTHYEVISAHGFVMLNEIAIHVIMLVFGVWQEAILPTISTAKEKYAKSGLKSDNVVLIRSQLEEYMLHEKPYLDNNLSIECLAQQLNVKRHHLSEVISTSYNKNFFNFIKEYRVKHVMELMQSDDNKNIKILYLAFDSGFSSKSGFNRAFKEVTNKTPTDYLKSLQHS